MTMRFKRINAAGYVHPVSTFTQAVEVEPGGRTLYFSGITARNDQADVLFPGNIEAQCRQVFANIKLILEEAGATMGDVVKTNAYVTHADYMEVYRRTKDEAFGRPAPPGTVVQVIALYNSLQLIEIELIAVVHDKK